MINEDNEQLFNRIDTAQLNEQISNDQLFDAPSGFEVSHVANIIEKLLHLSRFGNLLTLVIGNNGCGKTNLIDKFLLSKDDSCHICHIKAHPLLSIDQLFQKIMGAFAEENTFSGIPLTAKQYEEWAEQITDTPEYRLLIIDDTEVLSTSVLHELCQLSAIQQAKETPHLHLILVGNYDLNDSLEQAARGVLSEEGIYTIDIPSLSDEDALAWLNYLFTKAGVAFLPEQQELDEMLIDGQGNLLLLKDLAEEFSTISHDIIDYENEPETSRISIIGYWFAGLSVLILMVLGLFFFQKEIAELTGFGVQQPTVIQTIADVSSPDDASDLGKDGVYQDTDGSEENIDDTVKNRVIDNSEEVLDRNIIPLQSVNKEETVTAQLSPTSVELDPSDDAIFTGLSEDEQLLMAAEDESFVVQIIGLSQESSMQAFIAQHSVPGMLYYRSTLKGKPWFILVLGVFDDKQAAVTARVELTEELKKLGPWLKQLKTIKNELTTIQKKEKE